MFSFSHKKSRALVHLLAVFALLVQSCFACASALPDVAESEQPLVSESMPKCHEPAVETKPEDCCDAGHGSCNSDTFTVGQDHNVKSADAQLVLLVSFVGADALKSAPQLISNFFSGAPPPGFSGQNIHLVNCCFLI